MKTVICGAGHSSLLAAALIAEQGHKVYVLEKMNRAALEERYCWTDGFEKKLLPVLGIPVPELKDRTYIGTYVKEHYDAPGILEAKPLGNTPIIMIDRKALTAYLLERCKAAGVELRFGCEVVSLIGTKGPTLSDINISGVNVRSNDGTEQITADIIVEATGYEGRLRTQLEPACINSPLPARECLSSYISMLKIRGGSGAIFKAINPESYRPEGKKCFSWMIPLDDEHVDLGFCVEDDICDETAARRLVHTAINDAGDIITEIKSEGGGVIPMCDPVPAIVASGFMVLGDAASMVNPENGCGISPGVMAAAMLAQTVCRARDNSIAELWPYAARWFTGRGAEYAGIVTRGGRLSRDESSILNQNGLPVSNTFMTSWDPRINIDPVVRLNDNYLDFWNSNNALLEKYDTAHNRSRMIYAHHLMYPTKWDAAEYEAWYTRLLELRD